MLTVLMPRDVRIVLNGSLGCYHLSVKEIGLRISLELLAKNKSFGHTMKPCRCRKCFVSAGGALPNLKARC